MTTKKELLSVFRRKCIDCCVGQVGEVKKCTVQRCELWPYRMGVDPNPTERGFAKKPSSSRRVFGKKGGVE